VWNALTGERVGSFPESRSDPGEVQFSSDGALVTSSTGKIWDAASGTLRQDFKKPLYGKVVFSPDGKHAIAGQREKVVLWDVASGKELRWFDYPATASTLAFSRDGALAAAGGWGKEIDLWDIARGRLVQLWGVSSLTRSLAFPLTGRASQPAMTTAT
jgi:WD40 repeat protein